jgi:oligopeptide transport system substrate-binding protein
MKKPFCPIRISRSFLNLYIKIIVPILAALLLFCSCAKKETNVEIGNKKGILYLGNGQEPQDLDPHTVTGVSEQRIISALLEGLVVENPKSLKPEPGVAKSWKVGDNGLVYTFDLRKNAEWSNGDPVTAKDFVYSFKRVLTPTLGAQNAYMLYCMKNAEAYNKGKIKDFSKVGVKAINKHTLRITLEKPIPYFLSLLTNMAWFPVNRKIIEKFGRMNQRGSKWTLPANYVGNGPFKLKTWKINSVIKVEKNEKYWDAKNVKLNEVNFFPISDNQAEERAFRGGQLHVTYTVPTSKIEKYQKNKPDIISVAPYLGTYYYVINVRKTPLNDTKVRRALSLAIDRRSLAENVVKGGKLPAYSFTPPNTAGYTADAQIKESIENARKLLADAGFPEGKGLPVFEIMYNTSNRNRKMAEAVQEMWRKNLNVTVELVNKDWKVYLDTFRTKNYTIAGCSWIGDYADPNTFLDMWVSGSGNNRAGWSNKQYDKLIKDASDADNNGERYKLFRKAEDILMEQAPIIPLFYYTSLFLKKPEVKGWYQNILDHHPLKGVHLSSDRTKNISDL